MNFGIIAVGTRGDIQPFVSLSVALLQRGHHVTFIAPSNFKNFIELCGGCLNIFSGRFIE
jgi:UDP:flavonoid glycosyltransferase YjiC (YdhE family)